jgi:hypothetical protein
MTPFSLLVPGPSFFGGRRGRGHKDLTVKRISGAAVLNPVDEGFVMSTNAASQWGLSAIENLALIGKYLPDTLPTEPDAPTGVDSA